MISTECFNLV